MHWRSLWRTVDNHLLKKAVPVHKMYETVSMYVLICLCTYLRGSQEPGMCRFRYDGTMRTANVPIGRPYLHVHCMLVTRTSIVRRSVRTADTQTRVGSRSGRVACNVYACDTV